MTTVMEDGAFKETRKKTVEYSKADNFKKLSVGVQILTFLYKRLGRLQYLCFEMLRMAQAVNMTTVMEDGAFKETRKKTVEYSKADNFKKLSVGVQILTFLYKTRVIKLLGNEGIFQDEHNIPWF